MSVRTVGLGKTYDTNASAVAAMSDGDSITTSYTEYFDDPGVYWETVALTASKTTTWTFDAGISMRNQGTTTNITSSAASGKTHTLVNVKTYSINGAVAVFTPAAGGIVVLTSCIFHSTGGYTTLTTGGASSSITAQGCIFWGNTPGCYFNCSGAAGTIKAFNCVGISMVSTYGGFMVNGNTGTLTDKNLFAYNPTATADFTILTTGAFAGGASNTSTDGSQGSTDVGTIDSPLFYDWKNVDFRIRSGSPLAAAGGDPSVNVTDCDGNVWSSGGTFDSGCSKLLAASSDPTNPKYYQNGNFYAVWCDAGNANDSIHVRCTLGGVANNYLIKAPTHVNGLSFIFTTDTTVIPGRFNRNYIFFYTTSSVASLSIAWMNPNGVDSGYVSCVLADTMPAASKVMADANIVYAGTTTAGTLALADVLTAAGGTFDEAARNSTDATAANLQTGKYFKILDVTTNGTLPVPGAVPSFTGLSTFTVNGTGVRLSWPAAVSGSPSGYEVHIKPTSILLSAEVVAKTYLVATVNNNMRTPQWNIDISGNYMTNQNYYANVQAINLGGQDGNKIYLGPVRAPGGNVTINTVVNEYVLKSLPFMKVI